MARDSEKARPQVLPPTSKANGMEETVTARKMADEKTRKSHMGKTRGAQRWDEGRGTGVERDRLRLKLERHTTLFFFFCSRAYRPFQVGPLVWGPAVQEKGNLGSWPNNNGFGIWGFGVSGQSHREMSGCCAAGGGRVDRCSYSLES